MTEEDWGLGDRKSWSAVIEGPIEVVVCSEQPIRYNGQP